MNHHENHHRSPNITINHQENTIKHHKNHRVKPISAIFHPEPPAIAPGSGPLTTGGTGVEVVAVRGGAAKANMSTLALVAYG